MVENLLARALFDLGATHSFIFIDLAYRIKKSKKELTKTLLVSTPLGKLLLVSEEISRCEIRIGENIIKNDLVVLNLIEFDIILGMDWLSKHPTCIDCL